MILADDDYFILLGFNDEHIGDDVDDVVHQDHVDNQIVDDDYWREKE